MLNTEKSGKRCPPLILLRSKTHTDLDRLLGLREHKNRPTIFPTGRRFPKPNLLTPFLEDLDLVGLHGYQNMDNAQSDICSQSTHLECSLFSEAETPGKVFFPEHLWVFRNFFLHLEIFRVCPPSKDSQGR